MGVGDVTGQTVTKAAQQGDETAKALSARPGVGIASLANIFEVDTAIVGGGLVETGDLLVVPAAAA